MTVFLRIIQIIFESFNYLVLAYFLSLNFFYLITTLFAFFALRRYARRMKAVDLNALITKAGVPPVTLLAPAYNEEATCIESTKALLSLNYPEYEVIVINDGSKDRTRDVMIEAYEMEPAERAPSEKSSI